MTVRHDDKTGKHYKLMLCCLQHDINVYLNVLCNGGGVIYYIIIIISVYIIYVCVVSKAGCGAGIVNPTIDVVGCNTIIMLCGYFSPLHKE